MKRLFNRLFPYRRRCLKPWCWREQTYYTACRKHQGPWRVNRTL